MRLVSSCGQCEEEQPGQDKPHSKISQGSCHPGFLPILLPPELKGLYGLEEGVPWRVDIAGRAGVSEKDPGFRYSGALASSRPHGPSGLRLGLRQSAWYCCLIRLHDASLVEPHAWRVEAQLWFPLLQEADSQRAPAETGARAGAGASLMGCWLRGCCSPAALGGPGLGDPVSVGESGTRPRGEECQGEEGG